jgi:hypothetical protein
MRERERAREGENSISGETNREKEMGVGWGGGT